MTRSYYKKKADCTPEEWGKWLAVRREARRRYRTGVSAAMFKALVAVQGGACAVCGVNIVEGGQADHCHDTKTPRGVLCRACNVAEGYIRKTGLTPIEFGRRLANYLKEPPIERANAALELAG